MTRKQGTPTFTQSVRCPLNGVLDCGVLYLTEWEPSYSNAHGSPNGRRRHACLSPFASFAASARDCRGVAVLADQLDDQIAEGGILAIDNAAEIEFELELDNIQ